MTLEYLLQRSAGGLLKLSDVDRVAGGLRAGGLAVLPTETGYLLAAVATDEPAIRRAFQVKGRDPAHTVHVACSSLAMAREYADITPIAERILGQLTPGPVTVVVNHTPRLTSTLVTVNGTVGIRIPDHPVTAQVIAAAGAPLTATSLNRAGEHPAAIDPDELAALDWPADGITYVVPDESSIRFPQPSTLVRVTGPDLEILRPGPISERTIRDLL